MVANRTFGQAAQSEAVAQTSKRPPRLYFLFMGMSGIANFDVWLRFFASAEPARYRMLLHCADVPCRVFAATRTRYITQVPSVASSYCTDLVSPMNQLLAHALQDSAGTNTDKFVFVSDSTLPAKPFWKVYNTLTMRPGSDFCIFPSRDWADVPDGNSRHELAIKTHQWMVLSRSHAEKSVHLWNEGVMRDMMANFELNEDVGKAWQDPRNRSLGDNRNYGCLDEYWHMHVLFGPWMSKEAKSPSKLYYKDLTNSPLKISPDAGWQGACDTFALWPDFMEEPFEGNWNGKASASPWEKLVSALDIDSRPHIEENRPAWWDKITRHGIDVIRNSDFLFVRKFKDNPLLADGGSFTEEYSRIVLKV